MVRPSSHAVSIAARAAWAPSRSVGVSTLAGASMARSGPGAASWGVQVDATGVSTDATWADAASDSCRVTSAGAGVDRGAVFTWARRTVSANWTRYGLAASARTKSRM